LAGALARPLPPIVAALTALLLAALLLAGGAGSPALGQTVPVLTATAVGSNRVDLSWTPTTPAPAGYRIVRNSVEVARVGADVTSWSDITVSTGTAYSYRVRPLAADGTQGTTSSTKTVTTPAPLFGDDFASGNLSNWSTVTPGVTVVSGEARALSTGSPAHAQRTLASPQTELWFAVGFRVVSQGNNPLRIIRFRTAANAPLVGIFRSASGQLGFANDANATNVTSPKAITLGTSYRLQVRVVLKLPDRDVGRVEVYLNDTRVEVLTANIPLGTTPFGRIQIGDDFANRTFDVRYDNVVVDRAFVSAGTDPVIAAAGDIACEMTDDDWEEGEAGTTVNACKQKWTSEPLRGGDLSPNPALGGRLSAVLTLGDTQYEDGTLLEFRDSFDKSWGRVKWLTRPVIGNHEYNSDGIGYFAYFGTAAKPQGLSYYTYNVGTWQVFALNSQCERVGGCHDGSPQHDWLEAELARSTAQCTLAYMHHPLFSSGPREDEQPVKPLWDALYLGGADVVLVGHDHHYERFAPQRPDSTPDAAFGIREFIAGAGGNNHTKLENEIGKLPTSSPIADNSEKIDPTIPVTDPFDPQLFKDEADSFGILELTLRPNAYEWVYVKERTTPNTFTDTGSASCHGKPPA
jgi:hypothetical protein